MGPNPGPGLNDGRSDGIKCCRSLRIRCRHVHGFTSVGPFAQIGDERDGAKKRHLELFGECCSSPAAKDRIPLSIITREPRHILDDAKHVLIDLRRHVG